MFKGLSRSEGFANFMIGLGDGMLKSAKNVAIVGLGTLAVGTIILYRSDDKK